MRIILIRHGDPDYEHDTLTEKGRREAEALAAQIETLGIDDIYVSSLGRAQDTAAYSLKKLGKEAVATCEWLQEFTAQFDPNLPGAPVEAFAAHEYRKNPETGKYYTRGVWDMLPSYYNQHPELFDKDAWRTSDIAKYSNTVEKYDAVIREFDKLIAKYGYIRDGQCYKCEQGNEKTIALFCHYGITSVLLSHLWNVSPFMPLHFMVVAPTAVTEIATEEREKGIATFRMLRMGDLTHLNMAGEPASRSARFCEVYENQNQRH
ncbi:MAG: histidine phosphatase family protein [Lachnospiraceae bacterium]|nr:histidine phosphatase family protein [Lachnospiraceae bacterium]MBQ5376559.1 histidine phosphatase family protein [Lachnospiraceae bacterium]